MSRAAGMCSCGTVRIPGEVYCRASPGGNGYIEPFNGKLRY
ncbi:hypothetical protein ACFLVS_02570 [Chloroflexota bacterium]